MENNQELIDKSQINSELSQVNEFSEATEEDEKELDIDLDNLDSLIIRKKPVIYETDEPYEFSKDSERVDVFIKNYLMKFDMVKSLKILEQEFYELLSKKEINIEDIPNVPKAYIESEILQEKIGNIQKELDDAKIYAEKANSLFLNLQQAKESSKIKHRRVQQEKQKLIKEIERLKTVYEKDSKTYKDLTQKHWDVTKASLVLEQKLKGISSKVENLNEQADKLRKTFEEANRQKERNF